MVMLFSFAKACFDQGLTMNFRQFLSILRARWPVALAMFALTVGLAIAASMLLPKRYTATASVVIDAKPDPIVGALYGGGVGPATMATQVDVILSDRVALRVVRNLKLTELPQIRSQWEAETGGRGTIEQWLSVLFQRSMDVKPSRESNVINISYGAADPQFAAALANAFVQAYTETALELRVNPARQYTSFFDTRAKEAREVFERAQARFSAYQATKGIVSDERLDVENSRLSELSTQLVMTQSATAESGSRQIQARGASADKMQEVLSNPVIAGLKADLARSEARLQELLAKFGDSYPQVVEAKASIGELRARMESETAKVSGGIGVSDAIARRRESDIRSSLESQRSKVARIRATREEGLILQRDVESAQRAYEQVQMRLTQTSLEGQNTQSNVYPLTQATAPLQPTSPKLMVNTIIASVVGALLAIGIALLLELLDRRVRSPEDAAGALGLPVLGILPKPNAKRLFGRNRVTLMQQRLLGKASAPGQGA
jgi:polysaccharide biosynthesis transport protein